MPAVVTTFLHEDKKHSPDEVVAGHAPSCVHCGEEMWLTSLTKSISDSGTEGVYTYECKTCGTRERITLRTERADGLPVMPDL